MATGSPNGWGPTICMGDDARIRWLKQTPAPPGSGFSKPGRSCFSRHWGTPREDPGGRFVSGIRGMAESPSGRNRSAWLSKGGLASPNPSAPPPPHDSASSTAKLPAAIPPPGSGLSWSMHYSLSRPCQCLIRVNKGGLQASRPPCMGANHVHL